VQEADRGRITLRCIGRSAGEKFKPHLHLVRISLPARVMRRV